MCVSTSLIIYRDIKMGDLTLHPECQRIVEYLQEVQTGKGLHTMAQIRKNHIETFRILSGGYDKPFDGERTEIFIPSPDVTGTVILLHI